MLQTIMEMYARARCETFYGGRQAGRREGERHGMQRGSDSRRENGAGAEAVVVVVATGGCAARVRASVHMMRHLPEGGSPLALGCRFSISPRQSSKTFAVGEQRRARRVSMSGAGARRGEEEAARWGRGKREGYVQTLMFSFALVSTCTASSSDASCSPSLACTCLDGL